MSFTTFRALRRAVLIALAALLSLVAAASLPTVQLRIARAALSRLDGVHVGLDYLWAGPRGVTVEGLSVAAPGLDASVERVDVGSRRGRR